MTKELYRLEEYGGIDAFPDEGAAPETSSRLWDPAGATEILYSPAESIPREPGTSLTAAACSRLGIGATMVACAATGLLLIRALNPVAAPAHVSSNALTPESSRHRQEMSPVDRRQPALAHVDMPFRRAFSPSFAADGSMMVFHVDRGKASVLFGAELDARSNVRTISGILEDGWKNFHGQLSPDGSQLAFDSDRDGERAVYLAGRDGRGIHRVSGEGYAAVPTWSPDGEKLAFIRAERLHPKVWNVWVLDLQTKNLLRVSSHRSGQTWGGAWFPDGKRICYSHENRLIIHNLETGDSRVITSPRPERLARTPAVSPDGSQIAFQVLRDGVWLLDLESGMTKRILSDPFAEEFNWSPDGRRLAFHSRHEGSWGLWILTLG